MSSNEMQVFATIGLATTLALGLYMFIPTIIGMTGTTPCGPVIPGLKNWANWCFCNSVLQSLSSLPTFKVWLDRDLVLASHDEKYTKPDNTIGVMNLSKTMRGMIHVLNIEGPAKVLSSSPLITALESVQGNRISRAQQDAQEFLHLLLESIAAEQNNLPPTVSIQQMAQMAIEKQRKYQMLPFEGEITTASVCTVCRNEYQKQKSPFLELTLRPPNLSQISISDLIASTFQPEQIEDYNCIHCQIAQLKRAGKSTTEFESSLKEDPTFDLPRNIPRSHVLLERNSVLSRLPQILLLHINRSLFASGAYATRNSVDIRFSEKLELQGKEYELRSFVTHRGSHDRGHYISYRRKSGKWHLVSDETVRLVETETVLGMGSSTFLLFYEMIDAEKKAAAKKRKKAKKKKSKEMEGQQEVEEQGVFNQIHSKI